MGFSVGTHIGPEAAALYPEDYYAYIGMAQTVCDGQDNDTLIYDFMKNVFTERGDNHRLKKPEDCVVHLDDDKVLCRY